MNHRQKQDDLLAKAFNSDTTKQIKSNVVADAKIGTVAGVQNDRVIDGKDHFPINSENAARSAINRLARIDSTPDWFVGTTEELRDSVFASVEKRYPNLKVSVAMKYDKAFASMAKAQEVTVKESEIKDPVKLAGNEDKVPQAPLPKLRADVAKAYELLKNDPELCKTFANCLPTKIEKRIKDLGNALELAKRFNTEGISGEEFAQLAIWTQEDILNDLIQEGVKAEQNIDSLISKFKKDS